MRSFTPYGAVSDKADTWLYRSWSLSWLGVDIFKDTSSSKELTNSQNQLKASTSSDYGLGFSLYSTDQAYALQTKTKSSYPIVCLPIYVHISIQGHHTVSLVGSIHSYGPNCMMLCEDPTAPSRIHTYRCSGQVSSQETSDMNPATA